MNNQTPHCRGYTLLELLITISVILTLAMIGIVVVQRFANRYSDTQKISASIKIIHQALNAYYFTHHQLAAPVKLSDLVNEGYLDQHTIYNVRLNHPSHFPYQGRYHYNVWISKPNRLHLAISTTAEIHLQSLNPIINEVRTEFVHGKKHHYYYYEWQFPALLSLDQQATDHSVNARKR